MIDLLIMRHGPTEWNQQKRVQGHTDIPLSPEGRGHVQNWKIPDQYAMYHCVSSPLTRAVETARILGFEPEQNEALIEMSWGQWEGLRLVDLRQELGECMTENEARGLDFCPPEGESPRDTQNRLRPWLKSLVKPTLAIAHKGVIRALYAMASGWDMIGKPEVRIKNQTTHLFRIDNQGLPIVGQMNINLLGGK